MIIDAKLDYKAGKLVLIRSDGEVEERELVAPYFYAIVPRRSADVLKRLIGGEDAWLEEDWRTPIILKGDRYVEAPDYIVYKVYTGSPTLVPRVSEALRSMGIRVAASNVRYIIRNAFDLDVRFFDTIPLYYGFDPGVIERLRHVKGLVIDVEASRGRPVLASAYWYTPFEEVRRDDVMSFWLPEEADELQKLLSKAPLIIGHNVLGFDIPLLRRAGFNVDTAYKSVFDTSVLLATYGSSLKVGSARSLLDVALILKEDAGITDEEIEIKRSVKGRIEGLSREELVRYNANDVVITAKLLNIFYPFAAVVSALTQIPISEVVSLPAGMVAEYFLLHLTELMGYVPEYRPTNVKLRGERVWLEKEGATYTKVLQMDVKMMYPTFVLRHFIDPTLHVGGGEFDRRAGLGIVYSAVLRLAMVRQLSKQLKKRDPLYEPLDAGIKAILNALAYGVQGKQSGLAIMGNPWCPSKIFYGTREAQFNTIEYLRGKGIRVVYSDTDSFFVALEGRDPGEVVKITNDYLARYGLEVDVEDVWDSMFVYSKKNYILRKGDKVVVKGSALHNLERFYTPEAVSVHELLRYPSREERLKALKEMIESASIEDLFVRGHQQVWRLIGKDIQSWKRLRERRTRYMRVLTPWAEKPLLVLKKARGGQLFLPHSSPILALFMEHGEEVHLADLNPFQIVELRSLKVDGELARLKARYSLGDLLVYIDDVYTVRVEGIYYGIRQGTRVKYVPMWYEGVYPERPVGVLETVKGDVAYWRVRVDEDLLRRLVFLEARKTLEEYGVL